MKFYLAAAFIALSVFAVSADEEPKDPQIFDRWNSDYMTGFLAEKAKEIPEAVANIFGKVKLPKENPFNSDKWNGNNFGKLMMDNLKQVGDDARKAFLNAANDYESKHPLNKKN